MRLGRVGFRELTFGKSYPKAKIDTEHSRKLKNRARTREACRNRLQLVRMLVGNCPGWSGTGCCSLYRVSYVETPSQDRRFCLTVVMLLTGNRIMERALAVMYSRLATCRSFVQIVQRNFLPRLRNLYSTAIKSQRGCVR